LADQVTKGLGASRRPLQVNILEFRLAFEPRKNSGELLHERFADFAFQPVVFFDHGDPQWNLLVSGPQPV
jgi:hypothetical protein